MTEDLEIDYNEDEQATHVPDEELLWTHQVLNDFEQSIDSLGIETIMSVSYTHLTLPTKRIV